MGKIEEFAELFEKKTRVMKLVDEIHNPLVLEYFDFESDKNLDKKIEVLEQVKSGRLPSEIDGYLDILEVYPDDEDVVI